VERRRQERRAYADLDDISTVTLVSINWLRSRGISTSPSRRAGEAAAVIARPVTRFRIPEIGASLVVLGEVRRVAELVDRLE